MKKVKKLLAFLLIVATLINIFLIFPKSVKASTYPTQKYDKSYNYTLKTGDNLLTPYNSMFTDDKYSCLNNGRVAEISSISGNIVNELNGKSYNLNGNGIVWDNVRGSSIKLNSNAINIPLSDLGLNESNDYITTSFWLKSDNNTKDSKMPICITDKLDRQNSYDLYDNSHDISFNTLQGDHFGSTPNPFLGNGNNTWHHIVATFKQRDITGCKLYVDGIKKDINYGVGSSASTSVKWRGDSLLTINSDLSSTVETYKYSYDGTGAINNLQVWNRGLTDEEVDSIYKSDKNADFKWRTFTYSSSAGTKISTAYDNDLSMNYLHMENAGSDRGQSDTGAMLNIQNLKANTWYTASGYVRASSASSWCWGTFAITNASDTLVTAQTNIDNIDISKKWVRNSVTFFTGADKSINWRIYRGNHLFVDVTALKVEEGTSATPFISYNDKKTYGYGIMDNLVSPNNSYFVNYNDSLPVNEWRHFHKLNSGTNTTTDIRYSGYMGYNYYHMMPKDGVGLGDSGAELTINNLEQNTYYTVAVWMRIPNTSLNNGNGRLFITNADDNEGIASFNPKDFKENITSNTNGTWQLVQGSFDTGLNSSINIRINRGDADYVDFTLLTLQGGKNPIPVTNGAYSGIVTPYKVTFTPNGGEIKHHTPIGITSGRIISLSDSYTDNTWHTSGGQMWTPATLSKSYYDSVSKQTLNYSLNKSGGVYNFASGTQSYTATEYQVVTGYDYAYSYGDRYNYRTDHTTLGYMSNNTSSYYGGSYSYSSTPRKPNDFYAPQYVSDPYGWECIDRQWAEDFVVDSFWWFGYGQYWTSDAGSGAIKNRYRKGVDLTYRKWKTFSQPVTVTKYYNVWQYKQDYSGTFNLPDTVDCYQDYSTITRWNVKVDYTGDLNPTNLKALSVGIYTEDGVATSTIQAGQTYVAKVQYINDGDVNVITPFNIGLYDETGNKANGIEVKSANVGVTSTVNLTFTMSVPGKHTFQAKIDDGNKIAEVNELDNEVTTGTINVFVINIKTTSLSIVELNDETVRTSLKIGSQYRAKIKVRNDGGRDVSTFNIGLYGLQSPPPEDTYAFPSAATQLGTDYVVTGGLKVGEELGVTAGKDYAYITFTANSTDIHAFTAWADNRDVIAESNEYDNIKSLALNTLAWNVKANSLSFVDVVTGTTTTTLYKNRQYKAVYSITNDQNTDLTPVQVGLYDGAVGNGNQFANPSSYQLLAGQTIPSGEQYFTPQDIGTNKNYYIKADNDDSYDETNETDNFKSQTVSVYDKNITATTIQVVDSSNNSVTSLIQGCTYKANITISNSGTIDISEAFNVGLEVNGVLQTTKVAYSGVFTKGTTKTATISFTASNTGAYTLTGVADCDNQVWESNETDNEVSKSLTSYNVNLRADSIDIVGLSDTTSVATLQVGKQYRAMIKFTNTGQLTASNFQVALTQNTVAIGTPVTVSSLAPNTQATVYITFTADTRGSLTFEGFVDSSNAITETNETDNKVQTVKTGVKVNLVAVSVDIVGTGDIIGKNPLIQNLLYRAMITLKNDGDTDVGAFTVRLDECTPSSGTASAVGTVNIASLNAGASTTVYVNVSPQNRGLRRFTAVVDSTNAIDETIETDNTVFVDKTVNRVNVKAVVIDVQDSKGVSQTVLQKNLSYNVKVQLINDGDVNLGAFNLGLYDNGTRIASLPITSLNTGTDPVTFIMPFIAQNKGSRTLMAFADDNLQIAESDETDNKVQCIVTVNDLMLINYRIVSIVNPPSTYVYPLDITKMPVGVKAGYNITFQVDVVGVADTVTADFSDSSTLNNKTVSFNKIKDVDATHSTWEVVVNTDLNTPINTIINSVVKGTKGTFVYNYNTNNGWGGDTLKIIGSALEDFMINRTQ